MGMTHSRSLSLGRMLGFMVFFWTVALAFTPVQGEPFLQVSPVTLDGIISPGEYTHKAQDDNGYFTLYWRVEGENVSFAMCGATTGWVGVGFNPTFIIKNADMIIGWVTSTRQVEVYDAYATEITGGFTVDTDLGGTNDIVHFNGSETSNQTIIEFMRSLEVMDQYDKSLSRTHSTTVVWAIGENSEDNMHSKPKKFGTFDIVLDPTSSEPLALSSSASLRFPFLFSSAVLVALPLTLRKRG